VSTKPPTPQGISRLLAKAGFARAEGNSLSTGVSGYRVMKSPKDDGFVIVRYEAWSARAGRDGAVSKALERYARAIRSAGWIVTRDDHGFTPRLIVTAPESTEGE
jgi:hypothetical protein